MEVWIVNVVAFRDIHSSDFSHQLSTCLDDCEFLIQKWDISSRK